MNAYNTNYKVFMEKLFNLSSKFLRVKVGYSFRKLTVRFLALILGFYVGAKVSESLLPQAQHGDPHLIFVALTGVFFLLVVNLYFKSFRDDKVRDKILRIFDETQDIKSKIKNVQLKLIEKYTDMSVVNEDDLNLEYMLDIKNIGGAAITLKNNTDSKIVINSKNIKDHLFFVLDLKKDNLETDEYLVTFSENGEVYYTPYNSTAATVQVTRDP